MVLGQFGISHIGGTIWHQNVKEDLQIVRFSLWCQFSEVPNCPLFITVPDCPLLIAVSNYHSAKLSSFTLQCQIVLVPYWRSARVSYKPKKPVIIGTYIIIFLSNYMSSILNRIKWAKRDLFMRPGLHQVVPQVPPEYWVCSPATNL